jgi:hypothetical protein
MSTQLARRHAGDTLMLRRCIASSGEGTIWTTDSEGLLAKIYHQADPGRIRKLEAMIEAPPGDPAIGEGHVSLAWPRDILEEAGEPVGMVMPRIAGAMTLNNIYNPKLRRAKAPGFNWYYLHVAALNTAWIVEAMHARGYVVGDLKTDNFLVNERALVTMIDTDSVQVPGRDGTVFRCGVGSEGFTPPELIGRDLAAVDRTELHDRFGLAVIIHLLLLGYHPFSGEWTGPGEMPARDEMIRRGHWPYGPESPLKPGQMALPFDLLHPPVAAAFERGFGQGHATPRSRPSAGEWHAILSAAVAALEPCDIEDGHFYFPECGACPWCERRRIFQFDIFASPPGAKRHPVQVAKRFARALADGNERRIVALWRGEPQLAGMPETASAAPRVEQAAELVAALDRFLIAYRQAAVSDAQLVEIWRGPPDLGTCQSAHDEKVEGRSVAEFAAQLPRRIEALDRARAAVTEATGRADGRLTEAGEAAIVAAFEAALPFFATRSQPLQSLAVRAQEARKRLAAWQGFVAARERDDSEAVAAFTAARGLFDRFEPAEACRGWVAATQQCLAALRRLCSRAGANDDEAILALWRSTPALAELRSAYRPMAALDGDTPYERVCLAQQRVAAMEAIETVLRRREERPDEEGERAIVAAWDEHGALLQDTLMARRQGIPARVLLARRRLDWLTRLQQACAQDDDEAIIAAATSGQPVKELVPPALAERVALAERCRAALAAFVHHAMQHPADDQGLLALWQGEPALARSSLCDKRERRVRNQTPRQLMEAARQRVAHVQALTQALRTTPRDWALIERLRRSPLCRHASFSRLDLDIDRAQREAKILAEFSSALERRDGARICVLWNDPLLPVRALPEAAATLLRRIAPTLSLPARIRPAPLEFNGLYVGAGQVRVRWHWPDEAPQSCLVALRDGRFPETPDDVAAPEHRQIVRRAAYRHADALYLSFLGDMPHVRIWPCFVVDGEAVATLDELQLAAPHRLQVQYRLRRPFGRPPRLDIAVGAGRLPAMVLLAERGRPPIPGDSSVVCRIEPLDGPRRLSIPVPECRGRSRDHVFRLFPEDVEALAGLALDHPPWRAGRI